MPIVNLKSGSRKKVAVLFGAGFLLTALVLGSIAIWRTDSQTRNASIGDGTNPAHGTEIARDASVADFEKAAQEAQTAIEDVVAIQKEREELLKDLEEKKRTLYAAEQELEAAKEEEQDAQDHLAQLNDGEIAELKRINAKVGLGEEPTEFELRFVLNKGDKKAAAWAREKLAGAKARAKQELEEDRIREEQRLADKEAESARLEKVNAASKVEREARKAEIDKKAAGEKAAAKLVQDEKSADSKLRAAEALLKGGKADGYRKTLREVVEKYPDTKAAEKARKLLK